MNGEILLTIKLEEKLFADPRRIALLKQIMHTGSISQGAKLAKISYKSAWDAIDEMNRLADEMIVERMTGGKGGGGATVTAYGQRLLQLYDLLAQVQQKAFDVLKSDNLPLDSLLAAISRFSLQTSARNQFFGNVTSLSEQDIIEHIKIVLAGGKTVITAAITGHSANRLQLAEGKEVLVLIKAPWIDINIQAPETDNVLKAQVEHIELGNKNGEVLLRLEGGEQLCATLPIDKLNGLALKIGSVVYASFNAESAIVASLL